MSRSFNHHSRYRVRVGALRPWHEIARIRAQRHRGQRTAAYCTAAVINKLVARLRSGN